MSVWGRSLSPGGNTLLAEKTITQNGVYAAADDHVSGYRQVTVSVTGAEPELPADYQEVAYIDFAPHCGVEVEIPPTFILEAKFSPDVVSGEHCAFGYRVIESTQRDFEARIVDGTADFWLRGADADSSLAQTVSAGDTVIVRGAAYNFRADAFIGRYADYSSIAYFGFDGKIFYVKGWDVLQNLAFKFVPCYRKSDNTLGFYDVVGNVFYSTINNTGGGGASLGPDVT